MCVFLGSMCLKIDVERCFWKFKMFFGSLVVLHAWLHSYLCFSLLEKLFLSNLDTSRHLAYLSRSLVVCYRNRDSCLDSWWIDRENSWTLNSFSTAGGSIKILFSFCWIVPRQLLDSFICLHFFPRHLSRHLARYLSTPLSVKNYWTPINRF